MNYYIFVYLIAVSLISVSITVYDKKAAKKGKRRIPEKVLMLFSALGGSIAMLITMKKIRHKTKHKKFMIGIPILIILQAIILFSYLYFIYYGINLL